MKQVYVSLTNISHFFCCINQGEARPSHVAMSGRLIILPKKSWHPGKRENIEKVLRDERLAEEEAAAARERAREIAQEGIVETLTKKRYVFFYTDVGSWVYRYAVEHNLACFYYDCAIPLVEGEKDDVI